VGYLGDMVGAMNSFGLKNTLIIAFATVFAITYMHSNFVQSLCVSPSHADGGGGLLSFSQCCPIPEDWDGQSVYCWMDQHYPVACENAEWAWGEECVPPG